MFHDTDPQKLRIVDPTKLKRMWYTMYVIYVIIITLALYSYSPHVYYYVTYILCIMYF